MRYRNPEIPVLEAPKDEGKEFLTLMGASVAIIGALMAVAILLAGYLAPRIPFSTEKAMAEGAVKSLAAEQGAASEPARAAEAELQRLADRLVAVMDLPEGMSITLHYVDSATVNAAATLGGHIFFFRGLLEKLKSEDAVAAVLAHEIGHVRERHVIRALGRGVAMVTALSAVGIKSRGLNQWAINEGVQLTGLSFSREAEREADAAALAAVQRLYGHVGGVLDIFELFSKMSQGGLEMMKSHPMPETRHREMVAQARAEGYRSDGERKPLPAALSAVLGAEASVTAASAGGS